MRITAAISPCPNDVFIFSGLMTAAVKAFYPTASSAEPLDFEFAFADIETLNRGANAGRWDVVKISYANYAHCRAAYQLLPCGGALGRACGPLLLSNTGGFDPRGEILVPGERTTANFLLDFYLKAALAAPGLAAAGVSEPGQPALDGPRKAFLPFDSLYRRLLSPAPCQGVVIHEMRFTYAADGLHLIQDLGAHWEKHTGYPIPLGAVAVSRERERAFPGWSASLATAIRASLDWAYAHPVEALDLCRRYSQSLSDDVIQSHIGLYVNSFSRDLGEEGAAAVEFFLRSQAL